MINQLRPMAIFARVAETGSFRGAAKVLGLSPSVVSHHIAALEDRLGVALLYRSTRKIALTEDGEILLHSARQIVDAAQTGLSNFVSNAEAPVGALNVSLPAALSAHKIIGVISDFSNHYPGVALNLKFSDIRCDLIASGMDLVLRMGEIEKTSHAQKQIFTETKVLVAASSYSQGLVSNNPEDVDDWDFIGFSPRLSPLTVRKGTRSYSFTQNAKITVDSSFAILRLVLAGAGIAALPKTIVQAEIDSGNLEVLLSEWSLPDLPVRAVWPKNSPRNSLSLTFINFLKQTFEASGS